MKSIEQRKQRWLDFYDWTRPVTHVYKITLPVPPDLPRPQPTPDNVDARIDFAVRKYNLLREQAEWLDEDTVPFLDVFTGTEIFGEAFGCKVHYPKDNMPFAQAMLKTTDEVAGLKVPKLSETPLMRLFDLGHKARAVLGEKAPLRLPDLQSPLDIAALILDKSEFFMAMIEEPEVIFDLIEKTKTLLTEFLDLWFAEFGDEYIAHYPDYFMKGGMTFSEDEIGVVNAEMFETFSLASLTELSARYGGLGMHCCADSKHQWENFKKIPGLKLLNIVQPTPIVREAYKVFTGHVCQMHCRPCADGEPWTWPAQMDKNCRFVIQATAQDRAEALELAKKLGEICG